MNAVSIRLVQEVFAVLPSLLYTDTVESSDWPVIEVVCLLVVAEDEEQFEDNPEEYIRRDIEGSGKLPFFIVCSC